MFRKKLIMGFLVIIKLINNVRIDRVLKVNREDYMG
jgi:hypothetical protein